MKTSAEYVNQIIRKYGEQCEDKHDSVLMSQDCYPGLLEIRASDIAGISQRQL